MPAGGTTGGMAGGAGRGGNSVGGTSAGGTSQGGSSQGGTSGAAGSAGSFGGAGAGGTNAGGSSGDGTGGTGAGKGGSAGNGGSAGGSSGCPANGNITYTLSRAANPSSDEQDAYDRITEAMDEALDYYNCYTNIERMLSLSYVPSVQTADGNPNGSIRFGSDRAYMNYITCMHETSHVLGVGSNEWDALIENGVFTGPVATAEMREIEDDPEAVVNGDNQHFWPYGLNYTSEVKGESDLLNHMRMVVAIRVDLGFHDP